MTVAVLPGSMKPLLAPHLPDWLDARFFDDADELLALAPEAEIGWLDYYVNGSTATIEAVCSASTRSCSALVPSISV